MFSNEEYQSILHEIKNNFSLINSSLQFIQKQHPEVKQFAFWDSTMSDLAAMSQFFRELAETRTYDDVQPVPTDSGTYLESLQNDLSSLFSEKIEFSFHIADNMPTLPLDTLRMRLALTNLLKNASEAIEPPGTVSLDADSAPDALYIRITDSGCGITKEELSKIFYPAYTSKSEGSGLGLSIAKKIIEAHSGTLECQSTPGAGSTFTIRIGIPDPAS